MTDEKYIVFSCPEFHPTIELGGIKDTFDSLWDAIAYIETFEFMYLHIMEDRCQLNQLP